MYGGIPAIGIRVAATDGLRSQAYRVRHDAYLEEGAIEPHEGGFFIDRYDDRPTSVLLVACLGETVVGSLRFTIQPAGLDPLIYDSTPEFHVFADEMSSLMADGGPIACGSRFSVQPGLAGRTAVVLLLSLAQVQAAAICGAKWGVATVRGNHVRYYNHLMKMEKIAEARKMPGLKYDYALIAADVEYQLSRCLASFPVDLMERFESMRPQFEIDLARQLPPSILARAQEASA